MLDQHTRGILDKIIDQTVVSLPTSSPILHKLREAGLKIPSELDYSLGYAHGSIYSSFLCSFFVIYGRTPDSSEIVEIEKVISKRTVELKDALLKGG
jgi:hypothetical protein